MMMCFGKESGCSTELDYIEQTSWLLFLKYQWDQWAAPKTAQGEIDHNNALTGDDLVEFVNDRLFRYLRGFKDRATGPDTLEYKIREIFGKFVSKQIPSANAGAFLCTIPPSNMSYLFWLEMRVHQPT